MKHLSIKAKITLWYTVLMALLVIVMLWILFSVSNTRILSGANTRLKNTVVRSFREIDFEDGMLEFDDDFLRLGTENGIYLSVYDRYGNYLYGQLPAYYSGTPTLVMDELQQDYDFYTQWYIYDYKMPVEGYGKLWVRGITSQLRTDRALMTMIRLALIFFPFFVLCIAVSGYFLIRKALAPLRSVTEAAEEISLGKNLSRRIHLEGGQDEAHRLAHTFDHMMDKLETSFENEKQFTSDVSHELRTPTSVILAQCEYALSSQDSPEELKSCLHTIMNQARKMTALISQLLTLSRADSGNQSLHLETINLSELLEIIAQEQQIIADQKNITIQADISPHIHMRADETMMMRFFINLISNSIRYGKENGHVYITLASEGNTITGAVADDGIGISAEQLPLIWKRFYQADPARTSDASGSSGLGLPMVQWIAKTHGGTISAESTLAQGSKFSFTFSSSLNLDTI